MDDIFQPPSDVADWIDEPWFVNSTFTYIKIPKNLFAGRYKSLSSKAKLSYALLLDRAQLSYKNHWIHEGNCFVYLSLKALAELLNCSLGLCTKCYRELETVGLIKRTKQGQGKPDRIMVLSIKE